MNPSQKSQAAQRLQIAENKSFSRLNQMILPTGIAQHCKLEELDLSYPSSIDDNARAAIIFARAPTEFKDVSKMEILFDYLKEAQREDGFINNYRNWDGKFIGRDGKVEELNTLHDCLGRNLWALSEIANSELDYPQKQEAKKLFLGSMNKSYELQYPMSKALAVIGLSKFPDKKNQDIITINNNLSYQLSKSFKKNSDKAWKGFLDEVAPLVQGMNCHDRALIIKVRLLPWFRE